MKKLNKYSKKIVLLVVLAVVIFWVSETLLLALTGMSYPSYFVYSWFTFWSVELVSLAGIKITETRKSPFSKDSDDDIVG